MRIGMATAEDPRVCWLDLHRITAGYAGLMIGLLRQFGSPQAVFSASRVDLERCLGGGSSASVAAVLAGGPDPQRVSAEIAWLSQEHAHLVTIDDVRYPALLRQIADPPPLLYVRGDVAALARPQIALAGSRNPTAGGRRNAREFATALSRCGLAVTAGLALGIDASAHLAALQAGGLTIAIMGTGVDRIYPSQHRQLAHDIIRSGALVTEMPLGSGPSAENFPRRNRIISGMAAGVLVVEAGIRSGALITARFAAEQGREVFAIPGSIHSPLSRGCHALIRQGAKLVEGTADILEELCLSIPATPEPPVPGSSGAPVA